ncbi:MAG TPA: SDR family oxidoreductase [Steroidobacter sp.]|uniref:SDR family oxidoreductase n=1 Tax=Steroidobacter sp. TaxID=1978227 RepID=UPI002ED986A9
MKVAFVTGAAGDIGRDICALFLSNGVSVAGVDRDATRLLALADELQPKAGGEARFLSVHADVTSAESVRAAVATVTNELGDVQILVNNAGGITKPSLLTTEEQDWLHDIDLNLNGPWRCIHALLPTFMRKRSGVIVNVASVNGLQIFGHPGYSAAKAGLIHLSRFCAMELGKHGVRSVAICPGSVKTRIWQERQANNPEIFRELASWYPARDICTPQDVAALVVRAADDEMRLMNGAVITLDGGLTAGSDRFASLFTGEAL